eukprot:TRINITY_DN1277_c0_g1_i1.p1 TRINITY_DN1277_c0_g1~~TRINITY_DN1277_c0_g1_i1.p1  ORF type:complete len:294 (+),score=28.42 TRINITY_DN1277_c0_g1_i1:41-922(+)
MYLPDRIDGDVHRTLSGISAILSLIGCITIIMIYVTIRPKFSHSSFVLWLAVADAITALSVAADLIFPMDGMSEGFCTVVGIMFYVGSIQTFLWTSIIAVSNIVKPNPKNTYIYHAIAWAIPIPLMIVCIVYDQFTIDPYNMCSFPHYGEIVSMTWLIVLLSSWLFNFAMWFYLRFRGKRSVQLLDTSEPIGRDVTIRRWASSPRKMLQYVLIFLFCWTPFSIFLILHLINPDLITSNAGLMIVTISMSFFPPLQGFLNSFAYGFTPEIRYYIRLRFMNREEIQPLRQDITHG